MCDKEGKQVNNVDGLGGEWVYLGHDERKLVIFGDGGGGEGSGCKVEWLL